MKTECGSPSDEDVFDSQYNGRRPSGISKFVMSFPDCYCVADGPSLNLEFVGFLQSKPKPLISMAGQQVFVRGSVVGQPVIRPRRCPGLGVVRFSQNRSMSDF